MRPVLACVLCLLSFVFDAGAAGALTITTELRALPGTEAPTPVLRITGMFERGDSNELRWVLARLKAARTTSPNATLAVAELSSQGGDVIEGVKIGYAFREFGVAAIVRKTDICLSACAFAFLGGTDVSATGEVGPSRLIERGGQVGFHNVALNPNGLRNSVPDDRSATTEVFNIALGGSSLIIRYAADMGIEPRFISRMLGRPPDQIEYVDTVKEFLTLHVCLSEPFLPEITRERQAANICNNSMQWTDAKPSSPHALSAGEARLRLLQQLEMTISSSRSSERLAAHLRTALESKNDALVFDAYAGMKAAGVPLPELLDPVYEMTGSGVHATTSCLASLPAGDPNRFEVAVHSPKGVATPRRSAPQNCRWLFRHDANEVINPKRSVY